MSAELSTSGAVNLSVGSSCCQWQCLANSCAAAWGEASSDGPGPISKVNIVSSIPESSRSSDKCIQNLRFRESSECQQDLLPHWHQGPHWQCESEGVRSAKPMTKSVGKGGRTTWRPGQTSSLPSKSDSSSSKHRQLERAKSHLDSFGRILECTSIELTAINPHGLHMSNRLSIGQRRRQLHTKTGRRIKHGSKHVLCTVSMICLKLLERNQQSSSARSFKVP